MQDLALVIPIMLVVNVGICEWRTGAIDLNQSLLAQLLKCRLKVLFRLLEI
jgi:hypothetical protein